MSSITAIDVTAEGSHFSSNSFFAGGEPLIYWTGITRLQAALKMPVYDVHITFNGILIPGTKSFSSIAASFLYSLGQGLGGDIAGACENSNETTPDYITCFLRWLGEDRRGRSDDQIWELFMGKQDYSPQAKWRKTKDELNRGKENDQILCSPSRLFINSLSGGYLLEMEKGLFGMASGMVRKGDVVCVLFGCPMAIIMRRA